MRFFRTCLFLLILAILGISDCLSKKFELKKKNLLTAFLNKRSDTSLEAREKVTSKNPVVIYLKGGALELGVGHKEPVSAKALGIIQTLSVGLILLHCWFNKHVGLFDVDLAFYLMSIVSVLFISGASPELLSLLWRRSRLDDPDQEAFGDFQRKFLPVQLLSTFTDYIQGSHMYELYESYELSAHQISYLYLGGFATSVFAGLFVGEYIDRFGRRNGAIAQLFLNAVGCQLLRFKNFKVLMFGRVLSGITDCLAISYECWMISEQKRCGFSQRQIMDTFCKSTLGVAAAAVIAPKMADWMVKKLGWSLMMPFNICTKVSILTIYAILANWNENYGLLREPEKQGFFQNLIDTFLHIGSAFYDIFSHPSLLLTGLAQILFDNAKMIFVFMWTPVVVSLAGDQEIDYDRVFTTFMISVAAGSQLPKFLVATDEELKNGQKFWFKLPVSTGLLVPLAFGAATLIFGMNDKNLHLSLLIFNLFEVGVGTYFPLMGLMKAELVPERTRAAVMSIFKIFTNAGILALQAGPVGHPLKWPIEKKKQIVYGIGAIAMSLGLLSQSICALLLKKPAQSKP